MSHIIRERASVVCVHEGKLLIVHMQDPATQISRPFVPGGGLEAGETAQEAAVREAREETGYAVKIVGDGHLVEYPFSWDGKDYWCKTWFFKADLAEAFCEPRPVDDADYHMGAEWLQIEDCAKLMEFDMSVWRGIKYFLPV